MKQKLSIIGLFIAAVLIVAQSFTGNLYKERLLYFIHGAPGAYISVDSLDADKLVYRYSNSDRVLYVNSGQTIQSAIDTVIARGDNTEDLAYVILVAPGIYAETIDLDGLELYNLSLIAMHGTHTVIIDPASGRALESDTLNENLHYLYVKGFTFKDNIELKGAIASSQFLRDYCVFEECVQTSDADSLILTNLGRFKWYNGELNICNFIDVENAYLVEFGGPRYYDMPPFTGPPGATTIVANTGNNTPYEMLDANGGGDMMTYTINECFCQRQEPTLTSTAGSVRYRIRNAYAGFNGTITVHNNDDFYAINSTVHSSVVVEAGSTVFLYNSAISGSYSGTSTDDHIFGSTEGSGLNEATR